MRRLYAAGLAVFAGLSLSLCGCGLFPEETAIDDTIRIEHYEPVQHSVAKVRRGDLDESITVTAYYRYTTEKDYYLKYAGNPDQWGLEIHNYVMVGDLVKKGELLAEAPCEELEQQLIQYQSQAEEVKKTISYNKKLLKMAEDTEKTAIENTIRDSEGQLSVANARIAETQAKIADYRIYADTDGQVTYVADAYMLGSYNSEERYITVASSQGVFRGAVLKGTENVQEGEIYPAMIDDKEVTLTVLGIEQADEGKQEIVFQSDREYPERTKAKVQMSGEKRSNVLYIPEEAVTIVEQRAYVLVMQEDGFGRAKEVKVSGPIADNYIIESGLEEGDEVINE